MIELTTEQTQALEAQAQGPLPMRNPHTGETFMLIPRDVYELVRKVIDGPNRRGWGDPADDDLIRKQA
jgi:hypothetical protein